MIWKSRYDACIISHSLNAKLKVSKLFQRICRSAKTSKYAKSSQSQECLIYVRSIKIMSKFLLVVLNKKWPVFVLVTEVLEVMVSLGVLYGLRSWQKSFFTWDNTSHEKIGQLYNLAQWKLNLTNNNDKATVLQVVKTAQWIRRDLENFLSFHKYNQYFYLSISSGTISGMLLK